MRQGLGVKIPVCSCMHVVTSFGSLPLPGDSVSQALGKKYC